MLVEKPASYTVVDEEVEGLTQFYFYLKQDAKKSHHCKYYNKVEVIIDYDKDNHMIGVELLLPKM